MPVAKLIEKAHPEDAICLGDHLYLGHLRSKIVWLCPPPRQNTLPRACCAQILYMKQTLLDYGVILDKVPLLCDNESAIKIVNNPVQHSRTKHIDIRHHILRDHVVKNDISLEGVRSEDQLADIFTKPLDEATFCRLRSELNVLDSSNFKK
jgi:hypothetical protein